MKSSVSFSAEDRKMDEGVLPPSVLYGRRYVCGTSDMHALWAYIEVHSNMEDKVGEFNLSKFCVFLFLY